MRVAVLSLAALLTACGPGASCEDTIVSRLPSPDGVYEAVYSIHDCDATTLDAVWVRVLHRGADPESVEPIATFEGELTKLPEWSGRTLQLHYGQSKPFRMGTSFEAVSVRYAAD